MRITHIGGPTALVEIDGWRLLIDPTFDPAGKRYSFGPGLSTRKTAGPQMPLSALGTIDVILLSHDHHADNLDDLGRSLLPLAGQVITTVRGAQRLGLPNVTGLKAGESTFLERAGKARLEVVATPCQHGPWLLRPFVGSVIGFAVRRPGNSDFALWVSGDTILHPALKRFVSEAVVDVAMLNAGAAGFGLTGPLKYSLSGTDLIEIVGGLRPRVAVPVHFADWSHFREGSVPLQAAIAGTPAAIRQRFRWPEKGVPLDTAG